MDVSQGDICINKLADQGAFSPNKLTRPERPKHTHTQIHHSERQASPRSQYNIHVSHAESVKEIQTTKGKEREAENSQKNRNVLRLSLGFDFFFFLLPVTRYVCVPVLLKTSHTSAGFYI